jgi:hypothetical protein
VVALQQRINRRVLKIPKYSTSQAFASTVKALNSSPPGAVLLPGRVVVTSIKRIHFFACRAKSTTRYVIAMPNFQERSETVHDP